MSKLKKLIIALTLCIGATQVVASEGEKIVINEKDYKTLLPAIVFLTGKDNENYIEVSKNLMKIAGLLQTIFLEKTTKRSRFQVVFNI